MCGQNPQWNKLEGVRMLAIWAALHVSLGTSATPSQLKTTHSTPFFLPDRTAVRRHTRSTHKHTLSVLVSSAPAAASFYECRKQVTVFAETLTPEVSYCSSYSFTLFSAKAHTAVMWKALNPVTVYFSALG